MTNKPQVLIITGMHRSGTSLLANILGHAGLFLGNTLVPPSRYNPSGYFENHEIVRFHDDLLHSNNTNWYLDNMTSRLLIREDFYDRALKIIANYKQTMFWGWKDPRTILFLNFWKDILPKAKFLFIYRQPEEVVKSLMRRGDTKLCFKISSKLKIKRPLKALKLWNYYNKLLLTFYNQHPMDCTIIQLADLLAKEKSLYSILSKRWQMSVSPLRIRDVFEEQYLHHDTNFMLRAMCSLNHNTRQTWNMLNLRRL